MNENCWRGYKRVGIKKKGNRMVPNCVPENTQETDYSFANYVQIREAKKIRSKFDSRKHEEN